MGYRTIRTSDLSGKTLEDDDIVHVVVRSAPGLQEAKQFDCSADELEKLCTLGDLVNLEVRRADGDAEEIFCTAEEFAKIISNEELAALPGLRGRRPGYSPKS